MCVTTHEMTTHEMTTHEMTTHEMTTHEYMARLRMPFPVRSPAPRACC